MENYTGLTLRGVGGMEKKQIIGDDSRIEIRGREYSGTVLAYREPSPPAQPAKNKSSNKTSISSPFTVCGHSSQFT